MVSCCFLFQLLAPAVDWLDYLSSSLSPLELNDTEPVVLYAREYLQQVSELINKTDHRSETYTARGSIRTVQNDVKSLSRLYASLHQYWLQTGFKDYE